MNITYAPKLPQWKGTLDEGSELLTAIKHNCLCRFVNDIQESTCSAHRMLIEDQRALDGLLFERRTRLELLSKEFMDEPINKFLTQERQGEVNQIHLEYSPDREVLHSK